MKLPGLYFAAASAAPVMINVLGYNLPVLASILSVVCVALASFIAPAPKLSWLKRTALVTLLSIILLALAISDPLRNPLMSTCWAIGIGYSGMPIIQKISERVKAALGTLLNVKEEETPDV
jgi:hypothetical protein